MPIEPETLLHPVNEAWSVQVHVQNI